ncbi:hypothetical protein IW967_10555 [Alicyclobacillus mali]|uniref:Uncharacterized protein n=1 Tax=Alicyclobacillus mali (ex Roth et al. 2021) TaxID=1123961 RepID=A0ABS0F4S0_9BACL|nr:hypothetical protein [Alicyclobacillus mali (ex Roth et al. 2021)]MBF8378297.1 hypothetical protein [Alicyclobacillus mali (ex Roth et al. 2021)]MCL6489779.1 hypothetical protein [Alicyclobacillus mali (ex Roth et al. 2021)]
MWGKVALLATCLAASVPVAAAAVGSGSSGPLRASLSPSSSHPPTPAVQDMRSVSITAGLAGIGYEPIHPAQVEAEIAKWMKQARPVQVNIPKLPGPPIIVNANIDPPEVFLTLASGATATLMPTTYFSGRGEPLSKDIQHVPDVVTFTEGSRTWYLRSAPLYTWLMDGGWKREFQLAH